MYIIKVNNRNTKFEYFIGCNGMDFYPTKNREFACKFETTEQTDAMIENWLNSCETAYVMELNSNTTKPIKVKYKKANAKNKN